jgi:hypothetical protein
VRFAICAGALLLVLFAGVFSQTSSNPGRDVLSVDGDWAAWATRKGEQAKSILNVILADDYTLTSTGWTVLTKSEYLKQISGGTSFRTEDVNGDVEMSIADGGVVKTGVPNLRVTFRNLRDEEINLYLGTVGGRGPRPCKLDNREVTCTFNFNLSVTDASGTTRKFKFRGMSYVAGRLDPYIVHLQAHSTHTIELGIDQFWSPDTGGYESLRLDAGKHDISLEFEGRAPGSVNLDQPYIKQMSFWKGKLTSNTLTIRLS